MLGAAAGGGFPQWNCRCPVCQLAWDGASSVSARTQASLAVSGDGEHWTLLNAAPDLRSQIKAIPPLHPRGSSRGSPIAAVVLTGAEVDQITGLLDLRERQPFQLFGTAQTLDVLRSNSIFEVLAPDVVTRHAVAFDQAFPLPGQLQAELFAAPGKVPLYLERDQDDLSGEPGSNAGVEIRYEGKRLVFVPGAAEVTPMLRDRLRDADVVLFDGTLFTDDEMIRTGTGPKTGRRMGHMPIDGADGSLAALRDVAKRRIYIHLNNTNPVLIEGSPERRQVEAAGWEVAADGMEITL